MKVTDNRRAKTAPFSSLGGGDIFYSEEHCIFGIKLIDTVGCDECEAGNAIELESGVLYFIEDSEAVQPLKGVLDVRE